MTPEEKYNKDFWYVLQKIKRITLYRYQGEEIEYKIVIKPVQSLKEGEPEPEEESNIIRQLIKQGVVKEIKPSRKVKASVGELHLNPFIFYYLKIIEPKFNKLYKEREKNEIRAKEMRRQLEELGKEREGKEALKKEAIEEIKVNQETADAKKPKQIKIKHIRLDGDDCFLEINNGAKIISFKSKKKIKKYWNLEERPTKEEEEELKREALKTKKFKILTELWRFRWEKVSEKIRKAAGVGSDYTTLQNLTRYSDCESNEATRKHIYRLNKIFENEGVPIEIEIKNDKVIRLIIDKP